LIKIFCKPIFLPALTRSTSMPIRCRIPLRRYTQQEFGDLSYEVLREVFAIHNQMGRFFDEKIYKAALAARRDDVLLEEPIEVSFRSFTKQYFLDVLVAGGGLFEFKAVERLIGRHRSQLLNYLLLTGLKHGMLISVQLGEQPFRHAADDVAFKLTAFERPDPQNRFLDPRRSAGKTHDATSFALDQYRPLQDHVHHSDALKR
jgi:GxxExxY protein